MTETTWRICHDPPRVMIRTNFPITRATHKMARPHLYFRRLNRSSGKPFNARYDPRQKKKRQRETTNTQCGSASRSHHEAKSSNVGFPANRKAAQIRGQRRRTGATPLWTTAGGELD